MYQPDPNLLDLRTNLYDKIEVKIGSLNKELPVCACSSSCCSVWGNEPSIMYTCSTVPTCCDGYKAKGLGSEQIQCVEEALADYNFICDSNAFLSE